MDSIDSSSHSSLSDFDSLMSQDLSQSSMTSSRSSSISSEPTILSLTPIRRKSPAKREEVRTLFVSGLPIDVRPRELFLLFRNCKGYESSLLKNGTKFGRPTTPVGFVIFKSREEADEAREELQGFKMDPSQASALRLDFAKSNTRKFTKVNRQLFPHPVPHRFNNKPAYQVRDFGTPPFFPNFIPASQWPPCGNQLFHPCAFAYHPGVVGGLNAPFAYQPVPGLSVSQFHPTMISPSTSNTALPMCSTPRVQYQNVDILSDSIKDRLPHESPMAACMAPFDSIPVDMSRIVEGNPGEIQHYEHLAEGYFHNDQLQLHADDNCITMFVSNLGKFCTEKDLVSLFSCLPGYLHLRVYSEGRETCVAFVDFMDVPSATLAMQNLQGSVISPSEKGGIQIEFVKDKLKRLKHSISRIFPRPAV